MPITSPLTEINTIYNTNVKVNPFVGETKPSFSIKYVFFSTKNTTNNIITIPNEPKTKLEK